MIIKIVTVEPFGSDGLGETIHTLWQGKIIRDRWHDFTVDLPKDFKFGVLSNEKKIRIQLDLE